MGDIFGAIASRKIGAYSTTFWSFVIAVIFFGFYTPFAFKELHKISLEIILLNLFLGILFIIGNTVFNEALRISNASLVGTIAASFAALTFVLSMIFFKESVTIRQLIFILVIFTGVILSSLNFSDLKNKKLFSDKGILYALIAMVCWGVYFAFIKIPVKEIGWFWPNYFTFLLFPLIFLYMRFRKIKLEKPNYKKAMLPLIIGGILLRSGDLSFNYAINNGLTAIVAPIAGSYPTLFVFLAFLVFKDPIKKQQILGILTTLVGIVFLSFLSS